MRAMLCLTLALSCAACAAPANPPPATTGTPQSSLLVPAPQNCRAYTTPVQVGGRNETASGVACEQPDGSWNITDNTPGLPQQVYTMPTPGTVPPIAGQAASGAPSGQVDCREYTVPIAVAGVAKQGIGETCRQPDGSWRIVQDTPGLPQLVYLVPPSPYLPPDYAYDPWYYGPPFALGGSFVFVDRFHHFGHFHHAHSGSGSPWMGSGGHHH